MKERKRDRILVIDDEKLIVDVLGGFLSKAGFDVRTTTDSGKALRLVEEDTFDAVITDLMMTPVTGFQIVKRLRDGQFSGKIIVVSSLGRDRLSEPGLLNADAYIEKPFDLSDVRSTLERLGVDKTADRTEEAGPPDKEILCVDCGAFFWEC